MLRRFPVVDQITRTGMAGLNSATVMLLYIVDVKKVWMCRPLIVSRAARTEDACLNFA